MKMTLVMKLFVAFFWERLFIDKCTRLNRLCNSSKDISTTTENVILTPQKAVKNGTIMYFMCCSETK